MGWLQFRASHDSDRAANRWKVKIHDSFTRGTRIIKPLRIQRWPAASTYVVGFSKRRDLYGFVSSCCMEHNLRYGSAGRFSNARRFAILSRWNSVLLLSLVGEYIARTHRQGRQRPVYLIDEVSRGEAMSEQVGEA